MTVVNVYFTPYIFIYLYALWHIPQLLSCDSLRDPCKAYCIVLHCIVLCCIVLYKSIMNN